MDREERRFAQHHRRLFGYALALTRDHDRAADLVQDCAVRVLGAQKTPADEAPYRAWLFTIVRNLWLDRLRKVKAGPHETLLDERDGGGEIAAAEDIVVNTIAVRQAFERLTPDHRDILALIDVAGFGYKEAGAMLELPVGTVMSRVSRARVVLCKLLADGAVTPMPVSRRKSTL